MKKILSEIKKKLKALGYGISDFDFDDNECFLEIETLNDNESTDGFQVTASVEAQRHCCGAIEIGDLYIERTRGVYPVDLSEEVKILMLKYFFISIKLQHMNGSKKNGRTGRFVTCVSNGKDEWVEAEKALAEIPEYYALVGEITNVGSRNLLKMYVANHK